MNPSILDEGPVYDPLIQHSLLLDLTFSLFKHYVAWLLKPNFFLNCPNDLIQGRLLLSINRAVKPNIEIIRKQRALRAEIPSF